MAVQAKFFVQSIERHDGAPTADRLKMGVVCRGRENQQWASATPWGSLEMGILNEAATDQFEEGQEYLVTFTKVAKPQPGDGHDPIPAPTYGSVSVEEATHVMCEFCGTMAVKNEDGSLDWTAHQEHFAPR